MRIALGEEKSSTMTRERSFLKQQYAFVCAKLKRSHQNRLRQPHDDTTTQRKCLRKSKYCAPNINIITFFSIACNDAAHSCSRNHETLWNRNISVLVKMIIRYSLSVAPASLLINFYQDFGTSREQSLLITLSCNANVSWICWNAIQRSLIDQMWYKTNLMCFESSN